MVNQYWRNYWELRKIRRCKTYRCCSAIVAILQNSCSILPWVMEIRLEQRDRRKPFSQPRLRSKIHCLNLFTTFHQFINYICENTSSFNEAYSVKCILMRHICLRNEIRTESKLFVFCCYPTSFFSNISNSTTHNKPNHIVQPFSVNYTIPMSKLMSCTKLKDQNLIIPH